MKIDSYDLLARTVVAQRVSSEDKIDPRDFEWVHLWGGPVCDLTPIATPRTRG